MRGGPVCLLVSHPRSIRTSRSRVMMLSCVAECVSWHGRGSALAVPGLHIMLKREGLVINHKRTERIYSEEGLALRKKRRRKGAAGVRETIPSPVRPNQRWSMDFVSDSAVTGRRFRALAIVDRLFTGVPSHRGRYLSGRRQSGGSPGETGRDTGTT